MKTKPRQINKSFILPGSQSIQVRQLKEKFPQLTDSEINYESELGNERELIINIITKGSG